MQLSSKLKDFINGPRGTAMGTRDAQLIPEYNRVVYAQAIDDKHVKIFIAKKTAGRAIENINENGLMAVTFVNVLNYEAYQLKGKCVKYEEANDEEQVMVENNMKAFNEVCVKIGLEDGIVFNWPHNPVWAIEMKVEEAYEQTPKIGTGTKLETVTA
ncbi:MAG TPA: pyridoxamine 5'-phosphate oxidase family protein [Bacteroidia bacterium]|nr:pyridoxamine 5'-phosphate oxidase family protein [Bacteroidia bacterium]